MSIWSNLFLTGIPDSWAYRWSLVCMANGGMTALPNKNLVTNIGFGEQATHTFGKPLSANSSSLGILHPPAVVCRDSEADHYTFMNHFGGSSFRKYASPLVLIKKIIKSLLNS